MSFIDLLKVISKHGITLQKDINRRFDIDKSGKSDYFLIRNFEIKLISLFIESLDSKGLYSLIPMISINGKVDEPFITLTNSILITNYSNYVTIHNYIYKNYELLNFIT
jgi:hypothetical protein